MASGLEAVPLAVVHADSNGNFQIRAKLDRAKIPKKWLDSTGAVTVMLFAVADDGTSTVAMDTVWYLDDAGSTPAWFTSSTQYDKARQAAASPNSTTRLSLSQDAQRADAIDASDGERPALLHADIPAPKTSTGGTFQAASVQPPADQGYFGCNVVGTVSSSYHYRSADMVDLATYWRHSIDYSSANTTSWEVGYSRTGTGGWNLAGSVGFAQETASGISKSWNSGGNAAYRSTLRIKTGIKQLRWLCQSGTYGTTVYTAEAYNVGWQTDVADTGDDIACNDAYRFQIGHGVKFWRQGGNSSSFWANIGIWGFYGGQKITTQSKAKYSWTNDSAVWSRDLCGESGAVDKGSSRVSAMA